MYDNTTYMYVRADVVNSLHYFIRAHTYLALAVFARSPAAYTTLKSFNLLQLPSINTLKQYTSFYKEAPGEIEIRLADEQELYKARIQECAKKQRCVFHWVRVH